MSNTFKNPPSVVHRITIDANGRRDWSECSEHGLNAVPGCPGCPQNTHKVMCSWCGTVLRNPDKTEITHTICEACKEKVRGK